jgi:2-aminoadipate transaminase
VTHPSGGMFCWVTLGDGTDTASLLTTALRHLIAFAPGWSFYANTPDRSTMRLSFVTNPPELIAEGLRRLDAALTDHRGDSPQPADAPGEVGTNTLS